MSASAVRSVASTATPSLVLATDLDGTFLGGDDRQRVALYRRLEARRHELVLVFVTGRDLGFIGRLLEEPGMPRPDLVIGDVGTTVVDGDRFAPVEPLQGSIVERWAGATDAVLALLDGEPGLELQAVMGPNRVSYHYDPAVLDPGVVSRIEGAGFDVVRSAGVYLDVLPRGVAKGPTLLRLLEQLRLPVERVLVAGDTLNDLSLFETGLRGVAVGNSEPGLIDAVASLPAVHRSTLPGCGGIDEAIDHFGLLDPPA